MALAGTALAVAGASLGLVPGVPAARWLFALGSLALPPFLLLLGVAGGGPSGRRSWCAAVAPFALLLAGGAALLLSGGGPRWLGWPAGAWVAFVAFGVGPWLLLGATAARGLTDEPATGEAGGRDAGEDDADR